MAEADRDGPGRVDIALRQEDGQVVIEVTDNGMGFPREHRNRLLEPYATTREGGTGLGLPIVLKILKSTAAGLNCSTPPRSLQAAMARASVCGSR